jgi:hypothetical protein
MKLEKVFHISRRRAPLFRNLFGNYMNRIARILEQVDEYGPLELGRHGWNFCAAYALNALRLLLLSCLIPFGATATVIASQSSSSHYQVNEVEMGSGSALNDCSSHYCAKESAGDLTVGSASSSNYSARFGFNTSDTPVLELITEGISDNMGVIKTDQTGTASMAVKVRDYLSSGYVLEIVGQSMTMGTHQLDTLTSPSTSQPGTEQFGINLVANTMPSVGADPVQQPSSAFSFGNPTGDYGNADEFKYVSGDDVAQSLSSSGETDYTVSFMANVSNVTPAGRYEGSFAAVVVPVY